MFNRNIIHKLGLIAITLLALTACIQPQVNISTPMPTPILGEQVRFETVEQRESSKPGYWNDEKPGLLIITSSWEITPASQYMTDVAIATLQQTDFSQYFALIAFEGLKPTVHHDFGIQTLIRDNDQVFVFAQPSRKTGQQAASSLYHLIKVQKTDRWEKNYRFHLYIGGKESSAASVSAYIP